MKPAQIFNKALVEYLSCEKCGLKSMILRRIQRVLTSDSRETLMKDLAARDKSAIGLLYFCHGLLELFQLATMI